MINERYVEGDPDTFNFPLLLVMAVLSVTVFLGVMFYPGPALQTTKYDPAAAQKAANLEGEALLSLTIHGETAIVLSDVEANRNKE